jgi:L-alanine-DL-glutamate epimerase-like enolase superfamily enzyme
MTARIVALEVHEVRFPTSRELDGSDAMNRDPDYSAAYVVLRADGGPNGHGLAFTIGRGNDVQAAAIRALGAHVVGRPLPLDAAALGALSAELIGDSQLRWLGPEKGVMHMAISAVVNAAWDLAARRAGQPLWQFLASMRPEELVSLIDFRYLTDALTPDQALHILVAAENGRAERAAPRAGAAPGDVRRCRGQRQHRGAHDRMGRPSARALHRSRAHPKRPVRDADGAGLLGRAGPGDAGSLSVSRWADLGRSTP